MRVASLVVVIERKIAILLFLWQLIKRHMEMNWFLIWV